MLAVHVINTTVAVPTTTLNEIVEEYYDIYDEAAQVLDPDLQTTVVNAIIDVNPQLAGLVPDGTTPFGSAMVGFVWLPPGAQAQWRIPQPGALRTDLERLGVRQASALARMKAPFVQSQLATLTNPTATAVSDSDIDALRELCRFILIPGIDRDSAQLLQGAPIASIEALVAADQQLVKTLLEGSTLPAEALAMRPWFLWPKRAERFVPKGTPMSPNHRPTPRRASEARKDAQRWAQEVQSPSRTPAELESAKVLAWTFEVQADLLSGNEMLVRGRAKQALPLLRRVWSRIGDRALELGVLPPAAAGTPEATGPSLSVILEVVKRGLDTLDSEDVKDIHDASTARRRIPNVGLRSFSYTDLDPVSMSAVDVLLEPQTLSVANRRMLRSTKAVLADRKMSSLPHTLRYGTQGATGDWRYRDVVASDQDAAHKVLQSSTYGLLRADTVSWSAVASNIDLHAIRDVVAPLGGLTFVPGRVPVDILGLVAPTDRYIEWKASAYDVEEDVVRVPINAEFASVYNTTILADTTKDRRQEWADDPETYVKPERFLFALPRIMAGNAIHALAEALRGSGRADDAHYLTRGSEGDSIGTERLARPLEDLFQRGGVDVYISDLQALARELRSWNQAADGDYQTARYARAAHRYKKVLTLAAQCPQLPGLTTGLHHIYEGLLGNIRSRNQFRADPVRDSVARYIVVSDGIGVDEPSAGTVTASVPLPDEYAPEVLNTVAMQAASAATPVRYFGYEVTQRPRVMPNTRPVPVPIGAPPATLSWASAEAEVYAEASHAFTYLKQLEAQLNWLGFSEQVVPSWRFEYLLQQARYYCGKADELQQRAMSSVSAYQGSVTADAAAAEELLLASLSEGIAAAEVEIAKANEDIANKNLDLAVKAAKRSNQQMRLAIGKGALAVAGAAFSVVTAGAGAAGIAAVMGAMALAAAESAPTIANAVVSTQGAMDGASRSQVERDIAEKARDIAQTQGAIANMQASMAQTRANFAFATVEDQLNRELNTAAYFALVERTKELASEYLLMATRLAWLAERAYEWESRRATNTIRMNYGGDETVSKFASAATLLRDLDTIEHSRISGNQARPQLIKTTISLFRDSGAALQSLRASGEAVVVVPQKLLDLRYPGLYLPMIRRVDVEFDGLLPPGGVHARLSVINSARTRVPYTEAYVPQAKQVEPDWAFPPADGYRIDPNASMVPAFVMKPVFGNGLTQVLSEYTPTRDGGILSAAPGAADVFDHLPTDVTWLLELPREANGFDFQNIADVRIVVYFEAQYSAFLADRQRDAIRAEATTVPPTRYEQDVVQFASAQAPASFATFVNPPKDQSLYDLRIHRFEIDGSQFPNGQLNKLARNLNWALVGAGTLTHKMRVSNVAAPFGATVTLPPSDDGQPSASAFSAVGRNDAVIVDELDADGKPTGVMVEVFPATANTFPSLDNLVSSISADLPANYDNILGTWAFKLLPDLVNGPWLKDDDGDDVVCTTGHLVLANNSFATSNAGTWKHAEMVCHVSLAAGDFSLTLRGNVTATVKVSSSSGGLRTIEVTIVEGTGAPVSSGVHVVDATLDPAYRIRFAVLNLVASFSVDDVPLTFSQGGVLSQDVVLTETPSAGVAALSFATTAGTEDLVVHDVEVNRLRYDGTPLETVISERFADATAWDLVNCGPVVPSTHKIVDLSNVQEFIFGMEYSCVLDV